VQFLVSLSLSIYFSLVSLCLHDFLSLFLGFSFPLFFSLPFSFPLSHCLPLTLSYSLSVCHSFSLSLLLSFSHSLYLFSLALSIFLFLNLCLSIHTSIVGSIKLQVSFAEYSLFYRALLQKRPKIFLSLSPSQSLSAFVSVDLCPSVSMSLFDPTCKKVVLGWLRLVGSIKL